MISVALAAPAVSPTRGPTHAPAALGLAIESSAPASGEVAARAVNEIRATGVSLFALSVSWSEAEPSRGTYRIDEVNRTARLLRQSGAVLHLDLPLVTGHGRDVARDLAGTSFDDPRLSLRLGRLLAALRPALLDCATISLGYEADAYFANRPEELKAYRRLFAGAVEYLARIAPDVKVGVTTAAPTESVAPAVAASLHQGSPVLFYVYAPFEPGRPFVHRPPQDLETDWRQLLESSGNRPIAFPEVSYSSSQDNGSSLERQADFVRRLRRFVASADGSRLLFVRYAVWRDRATARSVEAPTPAGDAVRRRESFVAHRGLQTSEGRAKPAWRAWLRGGR